MAAIAKLTAFDIKKCGYYRRRQREPEFGDVSEILEQLLEWTHGKTLRETKLADSTDEEGVLGTYCFGIAKVPGHDEFILATWNETPSYQGKVASAQGDAPVGNVDVSVTGIPQGGIPGFPSYFYFIPQRKAFFSLRFDGQVNNGHQAMSQYIDRFVKYGTTYVVLDETTEQPTVVGYAKNLADLTADDELEHLYAGFTSKPKRIPGEIEWLRERVTEIRKLIHVQELNTRVQAESTFYSRLMQRVGIEQPTVPPLEAKLNLALDVELSEEDFDAIVEADGAHDTDDFKIGFKIRGSQEIHWLSHAFVKAESSLDVELGEGWKIDMDELAQAIVRHRRHLLRLVPRG